MQYFLLHLQAESEPIRNNFSGGISKDHNIIVLDRVGIFGLQLIPILNMNTGYLRNVICNPPAKRVIATTAIANPDRSILVGMSDFFIGYSAGMIHGLTCRAIWPRDWVAQLGDHGAYGDLYLVEHAIGDGGLLTDHVFSNPLDRLVHRPVVVGGRNDQVAFSDHAPVINLMSDG